MDYVRLQKATECTNRNESGERICKDFVQPIFTMSSLFLFILCVKLWQWIIIHTTALSYSKPSSKTSSNTRQQWTTFQNWKALMWGSVHPGTHHRNIWKAKCNLNPSLPSKAIQMFIFTNVHKRFSKLIKEQQSWNKGAGRNFKSFFTRAQFVQGKLNVTSSDLDLSD